jgi:hypothetical protein
MRLIQRLSQALHAYYCVAFCAGDIVVAGHVLHFKNILLPDSN